MKYMSTPKSKFGPILKFQPYSRPPQYIKKDISNKVMYVLKVKKLLTTNDMLPKNIQIQYALQKTWLRDTFKPNIQYLIIKLTNSQQIKLKGSDISWFVLLYLSFNCVFFTQVSIYFLTYALLFNFKILIYFSCVHHHLWYFLAIGFLYSMIFSIFV